MSIQTSNNVVPRLLDEEPWVGLDTGKELTDWTHSDEVRNNQQWRHAEKQRFFALTFDYLKENGIGGEYFEFGCHRVRTFRMALTEARKRHMDAMRFLAFDSFEGLPEEADAHGVSNWASRSLCTSVDTFHQVVAEHGIYVDRIETYPGFYSDSLTPELCQLLCNRNLVAGLVNIDCDLEESAVPIMPFLEPMLQPGTVVYIDDYFAGYRGSPARGVSRVFHDFIAASRFKAIEHLQVGWSGRSFILH